jgi:hypothetical protein
MAENRNIIPDFPRGHAVATNHWPWLSSDSHRLSIYPSPKCVLCKEGNSIIKMIILHF